MTIKQVLESRGIYSKDLELELLRAVAGEKQEYFTHFDTVPVIEPSQTGSPPFQPSYEITCSARLVKGIPLPGYQAASDAL